MSERHHPAYLVHALFPLYVALIFAWGLAVGRSDKLDLGSVGEWFGGVATAVAVGVALWVAIRDGRRRDEDRKDEQAAQARYVVSESRPDMFGATFFVEVKNNSMSPVFAVVVEAAHVSPDPLRVRFFGDRSWARIDPGDSKTAKGISYRMDGITPEDIREPNRLTADISFVDAAGLRWRRWANEPPRRGAPANHREPPRPVPEVESPDDDMFAILEEDK